MVKWEYKTCKLGHLEALNELGAQGWEAVGVVHDPSTVLLKRPVTERTKANRNP